MAAGIWPLRDLFLTVAARSVNAEADRRARERRAKNRRKNSSKNLVKARHPTHISEASATGPKKSMAGSRRGC
jgi:hypothetical protein